MPDAVNGGFRDHGAVGGSDGDLGAGGAEGLGEVFAGFFGTDEKKFCWGAVGLVGVGEEGFGQGLGYGAWGEEVGCQALFSEGFGGGRAYGGDSWGLRFRDFLGDGREHPTLGR